MEAHSYLTKEQLEERRYPRSHNDDGRSEYMRDANAIIHSHPFRRLKNKTQVFFSPGNDHICTRMEHSLYVASISHTIASALNLCTDLVEAIGLGHDLGHAPFGHQGEKALSSCIKEASGNGTKFHHELQGIRVVEFLCRPGGTGLKLTYAVKDGIVSHCGEGKEEFKVFPRKEFIDLGSIKSLGHKPATLEGCVVRLADKVAYLGRDIEDAVQAKIIEEHQLPPDIQALLGTKNGDIINKFVVDIIENSNVPLAGTSDLSSGQDDEFYISMSQEKGELLKSLMNFNYDKIYYNPIFETYKKDIDHIIKTLFEYLLSQRDKYRSNPTGYESDRYFFVRRFGIFQERYGIKSNEEEDIQAVTDFIAGFTDDFARESYNELLKIV